MTHDKRLFRSALGQFPTGVAVVTAAATDGTYVGVTVNSFASVSLDPPLVAWCLDRKSDRFGWFTAAAVYTVSILAREHEAISSRLARKGQYALDGIPLVATRYGPPALVGAKGIFECAHHATYDGGDHVILVGRVEHFLWREEGSPLVFFNGQYSDLSMPPP